MIRSVFYNKSNILLIFTLIFFIFGIVNEKNLYPLNLDSIIAYPVPFNPRKGVKYLTIRDENSLSGQVDGVDVNRVEMSVYDINGDQIFHRSFSTIPVQWSGRNSLGRMVKPGLYIIKLIIEKRDSGEAGIKVLRILVKY